MADQGYVNWYLIQQNVQANNLENIKTLHCSAFATEFPLQRASDEDSPHPYDIAVIAKPDQGSFFACTHPVRDDATL